MSNSLATAYFGNKGQPPLFIHIHRSNSNTDARTWFPEKKCTMCFYFKIKEPRCIQCIFFMPHILVIDIKKLTVTFTKAKNTQLIANNPN